VLLAIPAALGIAFLLHPPLETPKAGLDPNPALWLLATMALWWVTETFPIHWTAVLPFAFIPIFPVVRLQDGLIERVAANFALVGKPFLHPLIFLFMGGMMIGVAMEEHNLHRRIALNVIRLVGSNPRRILLGFVLSTALISMFISNTATAVMMVPIGLAVVRQLEAREGRRLPLFGQAIMLSIAYSANVGGIGTLIGTAPNVVFAGFVGERYGQEVGFLYYLGVGLPFVLLFLPVVFGALSWLARRESMGSFGREVVDEELAKLGSMSRGERRVLGVFAATCSLWIGNQPLRAALGIEAHLKSDAFDGSVAMAAGLALFLMNLIRARSMRRMSWDALVLLGGSFALAAAVQGSGLSDWMAARMSAVASWPPFPLMIAVTTATVFLSAFTSNTSTAQLMMVLVANVVDPTRQFAARTMPLLAGVGIAASCDFMLPAGTPPNAIVFGTGYVRMRTMVRIGAVLDLAAAVVAAVWVYFGASRFLGG
jgi:sodium-dependent dicarboxylate transporter 2/3/5